MKNQRGVALSGLLFWSIILVLGAVLSMKVAPTYLEYYKILKDAKATVGKVGPDAMFDTPLTSLLKSTCWIFLRVNWMSRRMVGVLSSILHMKNASIFSGMSALSSITRGLPRGNS